MKTIKPSNIIFQSVTDLMAFLEKPVSNYSKPHFERIRVAREFNGNTSFDKACQLASCGWPDAPKIDTLPCQLNGDSYELCNDRIYDVAGDEVDVAAYCSGEPECMVTYTRHRRATSTARLVFNISAACSYAAESLVARGAFALALVEAFDKAGVSTEIMIQFASAHRQNRNLITRISLKLKEADEPVDVDRLAFWLAHPASLRQMFLAVVSRLPNDECASIGPCYGIPELANGFAPTDYVFNELPLSLQQAQGMLTQCLSTLSKSK